VTEIEEYLINIVPSEASARELLLLMKLAIDDLTKARRGNLKSVWGSKITPDMSSWGYYPYSKDYCPACLAGCAIVSRSNIHPRNVPVGNFLNSCRLLGFGENYVLKDLAGPAFNILESKGVKIPPPPKDYCSLDLTHITDFINSLLELNKSIWSNNESN
jgi:hypothetical protein